MEPLHLTLGLAREALLEQRAIPEGKGIGQHSGLLRVLLKNIVEEQVLRRHMEPKLTAEQ